MPVEDIVHLSYPSEIYGYLQASLILALGRFSGLLATALRGKEGGEGVTSIQDAVLVSAGP